MTENQASSQLSVVNALTIPLFFMFENMCLLEKKKIDEKRIHYKRIVFGWIFASSFSFSSFLLKRKEKKTNWYKNSAKKKA